MVPIQHHRIMTMKLTQQTVILLEIQMRLGQQLKNLALKTNQETSTPTKFMRN